MRSLPLDGAVILCQNCMRLDPYSSAAAAAAKSLQSCPTLCDPIDGSPPDSPFTFHFHALEKEMATHSSVLAWRIGKTLGIQGAIL